MATLQRFARSCRQILPQYTRFRGLNQTRAISSSGSKTELPTPLTTEELENSQEFKDLKEHFGDGDPRKLKNWVSTGWCYVDREEDNWQSNIMNFAFFTIVTAIGGYLLMYAPNFRMQDWATREAYLEIDRREKAGLPLIDPYLVPPENVSLPTEEELEAEGVEIII